MRRLKKLPVDLLTHIFSGAAASTIIAAGAARPARRLGVVAAGAFGGAVPDADAVSLWSGFDATLGHLFSLGHTGREIYGGHLWYSHHGFFHSAAGAALMAVAFGLVSYLAVCNRHTLVEWFRMNLLVAAAFVVGYLAHLAGDLPTPAASWGGIRLMWPSHAYVGGTGAVWWWNNYDVFLLAASCAILCTLLLFIPNPIARRRMVGIVTTIALIAVVIQVGTRRCNYAYRGSAPDYAAMEQLSKEEQRRILGPELYRRMERLDGMIPINF